MPTKRLIQFQCQKEGTLFYYQSGLIKLPFEVRCPLCGSKRIIKTGRVYAPVDENKPMKRMELA